MTQNTAGRNLYRIATTTASALFFYPFFLADNEIIPSKFYNLKGSYLSSFPWEGSEKNTSYIFLSEKQEVLHKMEIIKEFASKLINNSVELDPAFARVVTDKFWDLV